MDLVVVAEQKIISAYVQGLADRIDAELFTGERQVIATVLCQHGRPPSADAFQIWLQEQDLNVSAQAYFDQVVSQEEVHTLTQHVVNVLTQRRVDQLGERCKLLALEGGTNIESEVRESVEWVFQLRNAHAKNEMVDALSWASELISGTAERSGYRMQWAPELGKVVGPRTPAQMVVLAGKEKSGKSAFTFSDALDAAEQGAKVAYFSPDMRERKCVVRFISLLSGVDYQKVWQHSADVPSLSAHEQEEAEKARQYLATLPIYISGERSMPVVYSIAKREQAEVVYLDYAELFTSPDVPGGMFPTQEQVSSTVAWGRRIADFAYTVIISQVQRRSDPDANALSMSSQLEKQADAVLWLEEDVDTGIRTVYVLRNRGPKGRVPFYMYGPTMHMVQLRYYEEGLTVAPLVL